VKTARFANIVEKCGEPQAYLLLMDPAKDRTFQAAVKEQRVMTVFQEAVGTKTDRGEIGFQPGRNRQFLVFPKSLRAFNGRTVVGIKYDLLTSPEVSRNERAPAPRPPKPKPKPKAKPTPARTKHEPEPTKVVAFKAEPPEDEDEEITDLKKQVRHAMALLEDGKAVAAFNLLKRAVG
jgi:outer membrane biosynthesis protein TonB